LATIPVTLVTRTILHQRALGDNRWYGGAVIVLPISACYLLGYALLMGVGDPSRGIFTLFPAAAAYAILGTILAAGGLRLFRVEPAEA